MARQKVTKQMIDTMSYLASYGHSQIFIARAVGLSPKYLSDLKHRNPDVLEALNVSNDSLLSDIKANMHRIAIDGDDKHSIAVGMKLLDKYDVDAVDERTGDASSIEKAKLEVINELSKG